MIHGTWRKKKLGGYEINVSASTHTQLGMWRCASQHISNFFVLVTVDFRLSAVTLALSPGHAVRLCGLGMGHCKARRLTITATRTAGCRYGPVVFHTQVAIPFHRLGMRLSMTTDTHLPNGVIASVGHVEHSLGCCHALGGVKLRLRPLSIPQSSLTTAIHLFNGSYSRGGKGTG